MTKNANSPAVEPGAAVVPVQREPNLHPRILMVEDDSFIRQLATEALHIWGCQVDGAADGAAAWDALNEGSYDLMITDNNMPKLSGLELVKLMRAAQMTVPVIMATTVLPTEEFDRVPGLRPAASLVKPYTIAELMVKVSEVLGSTGYVRGEIAPPSAGTIPAAIDPAVHARPALKKA